MALLVLVLVAVLVGLVGPGRGASSGAAPGSAVPGQGASTSSSRSTPSGKVRATSPTGGDTTSGLRLVALADLPREAQQTVALVDAGAPFPYAKDGVTFGNYERILPAHPRGWYREYTVVTPGEGDRGPRRIVTGDHDRLFFYTPDHYASFVQVVR